MKCEEVIRYEPPRLDSYRFAESVAVGDNPQRSGGDIDEPDCTGQGFDE